MTPHLRINFVIACAAIIGFAAMKSFAGSQPGGARSFNPDTLKLPQAMIDRYQIPGEFTDPDWTRAIARTRAIYREAVLTGTTPDASLLAMNYVTTSNNSMKLHVGVEDSWQSILSKIDSARYSVNVLMFGWHTIEKSPFGDDRFGTELLTKHLCGAARRGVAVNLMVADAFYRTRGFAFQGGLVKFLKKTLASGRCEDPLTHQRLRFTPGVKWNEGKKDVMGHYDHRKMWIVDGETAFVGGYTVSDEMRSNMLDAVWELKGPITQQIQSTFLITLAHQKGVLADLPCEVAGRGSCTKLSPGIVDSALDRLFPPLAHASASAKPDSEFRRDATLIQNNALLDPATGAQGTTRLYEELIRSADPLIQLTSPFFTEKAVFTWLAESYRKSRCRLQIDILFPKNPEYAIYFGRVAKKHFRELVGETARLRETECGGQGEKVAIRAFAGGGACAAYGNRGRIHGKVMLNRDLVSIGSTNLDTIALYRQLEANVVTRDPELVREVHERYFLEAGSDRCSEPLPIGDSAADFRKL